MKAQATLQQTDTGWTFKYDHGDGHATDGGACDLPNALDAIGRVAREYTEKSAAKASGHVCRYCGEGVESPDPACTICRHCHFNGRGIEEGREGLLAAMRALPGVSRVGVDYLAGGMWGLSVECADGRTILCTKGPEGGTLPEEPWERWGQIGVYTDVEDEGYSEPTAWRDTECDATWTCTDPACGNASHDMEETDCEACGAPHADHMDEVTGWTDADLVRHVTYYVTKAWEQNACCDFHASGPDLDSLPCGGPDSDERFVATEDEHAYTDPKDFWKFGSKA